MKKIILMLAIAGLVSNLFAQSKFEVKDLDTFKLHAYITADPMGDISYIIEGAEGLVILEPPVFKDNIKEFGNYRDKLGKQVVKVINNYHAAGFSAYEPSLFVMVEGMPSFIKGDIYNGMMANFANAFGDTMDQSELASPATVKKDGTESWAGITFRLSPGVATDFPAASILIGGKAYYTHFTPVANMHMGALQISNREAVDATLVELKQGKASGATVFIGGHGAGMGDINAVNFQIEYLEKVKETMSAIRTGDEFALVMKMNYPDIAGEESLVGMAANLYAQKKTVVLDISHESPTVYTNANPNIFELYKEIVTKKIGANLIINEDKDLDASFLAKADLLIILSPLSTERETPKNNLTPVERKDIVNYVENGGKLIFFMDEEHRVDMEVFGGNDIVKPFGMEFGLDLPPKPNAGATTLITEVVQNEYELSYSGSRSLTGGTPISRMNGEEGHVHGAYVKLDNGGKIVAFGETMTGLFLGGVEATFPNGMTVKWRGKDDRIFNQELIKWMLQ